MPALALILVHGFPFDHTLWAHAQGALSRDHRVLAPDLPGFGATPPFARDPASIRVDDFARFLIELADRDHVDRIVPVGHSMGGYVALAMHRLAPARIAALALVSSRAIADTDAARATRVTNAARVLAEGVGFLADDMSKKPLSTASPPDPALVLHLRRTIERASPAGCAAALHAMAARPDATGQLATIDVPTLVIAGRHDAIIPPMESEDLVRRLQHGDFARATWCEKSGHMPMLEEPEVVTDALVTWSAALAS